MQELATVRAYRAGSTALAHVPPPVSVPLARWLFLGAYALWPAKRRNIMANAAHVLRLPAHDPVVGRLARRIYATYARYVVELMRLPSLPPDAPARLMAPEGTRAGDSFGQLHGRLRGEGRAIIAVSAHIGSIEALVAAFAARGWPTYAVADDSAYPELYELLAEQRRSWGVEVIAWRNLREIYRVLREGAILGLLIDWGYRADGVPVQLFGSWTTLPAGPAVLAARTGAVIVPVVCRRRPDGLFGVQIFDPIESRGSFPADIAAVTQQVAVALEAMIEPAPEQWYTFKPMWPATPAEEQRLAERHALMLAEDAHRPRRATRPARSATAAVG